MNSTRTFLTNNTSRLMPGLSLGRALFRSKTSLVGIFGKIGAGSGFLRVPLFSSYHYYFTNATYPYFIRVSSTVIESVV
jgi:hypothetical protein